MQKKIIALAIAGLASSAAFAQTNVQIYGILDAGLAYAGNTQGRGSFVNQNGILAGNRLGFKGTEDLGNGLKAVFTLEQGFNLNDGSQASATNGAFQRQAWVGLAGGFGTVTLGRQYAPGYAAFLANDALAGALLSAGMTLNQAAQFTIAGNSNARWNNSVKYVSPTVAGFTGEAIYRFGEASNDMASNEGYGLGLNYKGGPVNVNYVYQHTDGSAQGTVEGLTAVQWVASTPATGAIIDEHYVGATFDAGFAKFMGSYNWAQTTGRSGSGMQNAQMFVLGTIVPAGKVNLHANYALLDLDGNNRRANAASGQAQSFGFAVTYPMSKRTVLYAGANYTDLPRNYASLGYTGAQANGASSVAALNNQNAANLINGGGDGVTAGFGINHSF